ncbi:MAG: MipA/OmpV family protein [Planctomycetota bacterium]|nr:MipA/OmpV family protein [Planctomycetota bacterium]
MKTSHCIKRLGLAWAMAGTLVVPAAHAQLVPPVDAIDVNLVSLGLGSAPDYSGSSNNVVGLAPAARYKFQNSERFVLLLGPTLSLNLVNSPTWRAGPLLNYRFQRDDEDEDAVVKQMTEIEAKVEAGVFLQYNLPLSAKPFHQLSFSGDIAGSGNGTVGHLRMMYWYPFREGVIANIGVGMTYGDDEFVQTYYGVYGKDISLFPSLGGRAYSPSGGVTGVNIPFGVSVALSRNWLLSAGGRYERLQGDAADSPIVSERGKATQWIYGMGLSYLF